MGVPDAPIHDARGLDDHLPPVSGEIDFKNIGINY
jgi:hypothetical protein